MRWFPVISLQAEGVPHYRENRAGCKPPAGAVAARFFRQNWSSEDVPVPLPGRNRSESVFLVFWLPAIMESYDDYVPPDSPRGTGGY